MAPLAGIHQLSNKYLWDNETTQEAKDSQAFALFKATVPPSQGLHSPKHKKRKVSRLPSTCRSLCPWKSWGVGRHRDRAQRGELRCANSKLSARSLPQK